MLNQNFQSNYQTINISTPSQFNAWAKQYEVNSMAPQPLFYQTNPNLQNMVNNQ